MPRSHDPWGEAIASPDRGDHGAGDNRSDAGDAHQAFTPSVPFGKLLDLAGQALDALIEQAPVAMLTVDLLAYRPAAICLGRSNYAIPLI